MKRLRKTSMTPAVRPAVKISIALCSLGFACALTHGALAQQSEPSATPQPQQSAPAATAPDQQAAPASTPTSAEKPAQKKEPELTEEELRQKYEGKTFYLRGGYLDNSLSFDEHGKVQGHAPQGSFTLALIQIDKVHLSKRKVDMTGIRYGLHFLGALPNEDPTKASDKVRITPKKKTVKISIDRELIVNPKKKKKDANIAAAKPGDPAVKSDSAAQPEQAEVAPAPSASGEQTTTTDPAHSAHLMRSALDNVFAANLDDRMISTLPSFWKLYYQAVAAQSDYKPTDTSIYRQSAVDQKAHIVSAIEPPSNEFAQNAGVVGMALYHTVIGADGKPQEIVVARPIGFGLDENAADSIRKAQFEPALKDGKPVPVMLDVVVQFRIYSKRTDQPASTTSDEASATPKLPGPYSVNHP